MSTEHDGNVDELVEVTESPPTRPSQGVQLPGPGLGEALLWIVGYFVAQLGFAIVIGIFLGVLSGGDEQVLKQKLGTDGLLSAYLLPSLLSLLIMLPLGIWRLRPDARRKLNLAVPSLTQTVILLATTTAISLFCSGLLSLLQPIFLRIVGDLPPELSRLIESFDIHPLLLEFEGASFLVLLFYVAVLPALSEEFLFRGLIGRGLVARWGMVGGVLLTSLLFACIHMYPPNVVALIPLAILMHIAYLATRSFWAPVLVHFVNNSLAVLQLRFGVGEIDPQAVPALLDWMTLAVSGAVGVFGTVALTSVRTEYRDSESHAALPAYPTVEAPPKQLGLRRIAPFSGTLILLFTVILLVEAFHLWNMILVNPAVDPVDAILLQ